MSPEVYELSGADIYEHSPGYNRLIIKIVPKSIDNNNGSSTKENLSKFIDSTSTTQLYNSTASVHSISDRETVLFLGFEESWERDQWSGWLSEVRTIMMRVMRKYWCVCVFVSIRNFHLICTAMV